MSAKEKRDTVPVEEVVLSHAYSIEAIVNMLILKGICTEEELIEEVKKIKKKHGRKIN